MSLSETSPFPLVGLTAVSNAQNEWVALSFQISAVPDESQLTTLQTVFGYPDMDAALAPLDYIVTIAGLQQYDVSQLAFLQPARTILRVPAQDCGEPAMQAKCKQLAEAGYRLMVDGEVGVNAGKCAIRSLAFNCREALPSELTMLTMAGPHLALQVDTPARLAECSAAGFTLFSGDYVRHPQRESSTADGTSRKRLLALLGLLARDADSRELEILLKQDPALAYHLLKVVNSAAFAPKSPIHSFGQAINVLGRRQLQRWLQLLLYARQQDDGGANALLPLAAVRAARMEALAKLRGGDRDQQDMAFVAGVFSLLDVLLDMPMTEIVSALSLDLDVVMALLDRAGPMGDMLTLVEQDMPDSSALRDAGIDNEANWRSLLQACHWAIQVSRNL
ncbi:HDOD domain-containing protein [Massilia sp. FT127W]|uniref:HDOD domain-containing protein n=1 Tax=Pseudoduganella aquatica TaxID=2660641 RepID=A0A7X4HCR1_9BURK|nr:HDOD domain-containing protein [Pseudoduganella aquatica]MYN08775.1 HDOD domain-containing protein [Pseudoduganella aquatica]